MKIIYRGPLAAASYQGTLRLRSGQALQPCRSTVRHPERSESDREAPGSPSRAAFARDGVVEQTHAVEGPAVRSRGINVRGKQQVLRLRARPTAKDAVGNHGGRYAPDDTIKGERRLLRLRSACRLSPTDHGSWRRLSRCIPRARPCQCPPARGSPPAAGKCESCLVRSRATGRRDGTPLR